MAAPSVVTDAGSRKSRWEGWLLFGAAAVVAFLLYRPDTNAPFEIIDFSETLPILTDGRSFGDRFQGLVQYYLQHGRAAFGLSAGLAAKWTAFGWWTPGWQWTRYAVGLAVVVLAWRLLRELGANRTGATVGASLFVVSETAAPGWLRPAVNEPFGTLLLLVASLLACRYQASERPARLAVTIAVLLALMIVVKETLVAATFFPIALALCMKPDGTLDFPARSRRDVVLLGASAVAVILVSLPVLWALTQTAPDGYARQFGASDSIVSNAVFGALPALIPFTPVSQPPGWAATAADVSWLTLLMAGFRGTPDYDRGRTHRRLLLALALALPLARVLVYLPWPLQYPYYSIPYLTGVAIVFALGATRLTESGVGGHSLAGLLAALVMAYSASVAGAQTSRYFALRRLTDLLVTELHTLTRSGQVGHIVVAVPNGKEPKWWGLGPTLARYGAATARPLDDVREVPCDEVERAMDQGPRSVFTALRHQCDLGDSSNSGPFTVARRFDSSRFRVLRDTLRAQLVIGSQTGERR